MKRVTSLVVLFVLTAACARSDPKAARTPQPSSPGRPTGTSTSTPHPTPTPAPEYDVAYVAVSVATVWTYPTSPRAVDAPAMAIPAQPRRWIEGMTYAQKLGLVGRVQTQVLYGTKVNVLARSGSWTDIAVPDQPSQKNPAGYPGWVPTAQLTTDEPPRGERVVVSAPTAWSFDVKSHKRLIEFSYGTSLHVVKRTATNVEVELLDGRHASIAAEDVVPPSHNVLREARRFVDLPYLWGGTSGFGFDCSGFTHLLYRTLGITIARDTDQQAKNGRPAPLGDLRPGDILFVADSRGNIVHDAMYYGVTEGQPSIIESPNTGKNVRIVPMSTHTYVSARRILPS
jgi:gamma-D-glutamyl-L-lysine dipeptidyl-peptidase